MALERQASESTPLIQDESLPSASGRIEEHQQHAKAFLTSLAVLPIAMLVALALAATAATTVYAYADLACEDPAHCKDDEKRIYSGTVAVAMTIANGCALGTLGAFAKVSKKDHKIGLAVWLVCRAMGVVILALGVSLRSVAVAVSGQIFEGLASDNILHFNLNAVYVQNERQRTVSRLIGTSLALYMIGISVAPSIASLLPDFRASFVMALAIFAFAIVYLLAMVPSKDLAVPQARSDAIEHAEVAIGPTTGRPSLLGILKTTADPLTIFHREPFMLFPGLTMFLYNAIQSYIFSAIMVHTSLHFGFTGRENGFLISIAHGVASVYLLSTLFLGPYILTRMRRNQKESSQQAESSRNTPNVLLAISSLLVQAMSLFLIAIATRTWQIYASMALCALGLSTPSFIKSFFVTLFSHSEAPKALAGLAMMETMGGLIAPAVVGGLQTVFPGRGVFFFAGACVIVATIVFASGVTILNLRRGKKN